jgi:hypothetical protein
MFKKIEEDNKYESIFFITVVLLKVIIITGVPMVEERTGTGEVERRRHQGG